MLKSQKQLLTTDDGLGYSHKQALLFGVHYTFAVSTMKHERKSPEKCLLNSLLL